MGLSESKLNSDVLLLEDVAFPVPLFPLDFRCAGIFLQVPFHANYEATNCLVTSKL